jgi:succinate dehydrogenase/fumarate reductase cytochrome b subunit
MRRLQAGSGLALAAFLFFHLLALVASAFGPGLYDAVQTRTRLAYTWWPIELGLLLALSLHLGIGLHVAVKRRRSGIAEWRRAPTRVRWQRYTAYFLALVMVGHIAATRLPELMYGTAPGFAGVNFTMWYLPLLFYPYYLALALAGLFHMVNGAVVALGRLGRPLPANWRSGRTFWGLVVSLALACALGWASLGGHLYEIEDPRRSDYGCLGEELGLVEFGTTLSTGSR